MRGFAARIAQEEIAIGGVEHGAGHVFERRLAHPNRGASPFCRKRYVQIVRKMKSF